MTLNAQQLSNDDDYFAGKISQLAAARSARQRAYRARKGL
jgi:hypothetical protein